MVLPWYYWNMIYYIRNLEIIWYTLLNRDQYHQTPSRLCSTFSQVIDLDRLSALSHPGGASSRTRWVHGPCTVCEAHGRWSRIEIGRWSRCHYAIQINSCPGISDSVMSKNPHVQHNGPIWTQWIILLSWKSINIRYNDLLKIYQDILIFVWAKR